MLNAFFSDKIHRGGTIHTPTPYEVESRAPARIPDYMMDNKHPVCFPTRIPA
jgi:hypothetical protein